MNMTIRELAAFFSIKIENDTLVECVCTDTRNIKKNSIFIAIEGENFDGHNYLQQAFENGAVCAIIHKDINVNFPTILVKDTKKALLYLAKKYREYINPYVVAVTGSVGKTTTKDMIASVLSRNFNTLKTQGNLNNEIGLPLTLLELEKEHEAAVVEMGMSDLGEIHELSETSMPNACVITNIGVSHIETLKTRENILKAKLEILDGATANSPLILCGDNDLLWSLKGKLNHKNMIYYGINNILCDVYAYDIKQIGEQTRFIISYNEQKIVAKIPTIGEHHILNSLAAFVVGKQLNMSATEIVAGFRNYIPSGMRQNIVEKNNIKIIQDCYNASPDSMICALDVLNKIDVSGRRIAVLGDMLELGENSILYHAQIGNFFKNSNVDLLVCYGDLSKAIVESAVEDKYYDAFFFSDKQACINFLKKNISPGDCLLFKASRGIRLEEIMNNIFEED